MSRSTAVAAVDEVLTVARVPAGQLWGAGVDVIDHDRFALAFRRTGPALLRRVFDDSERSGTDWSRDGDELTRLGRLFGIKESVIKIAGGLPAGAGYRSIVVGKPGDDGVRTIELRDALARWASREQVKLVGGVLPAGQVLPTGTPHLDLCWAAATCAETGAGERW
ncbi:4'-phosphopantetheinyl transferase superfamily protein [Kribbella sp. NPDC023855]|uniref:4'-phosphopantetheinyl transferase superfamily protein n=1 Tax=Kribbella sp. NPDC023855 TaxID=3154698 RepID=UPI0033E74B45